MSLLIYLNLLALPSAYNVPYIEIRIALSLFGQPQILFLFSGVTGSR